MPSPAPTVPVWSLHNDKYPKRYRISCEIDGKEYRGNYWVAGKILTVSTAMGGRSRQVGSTQPEALAKELLGYLAKDGKA